jgi:hypothetical protein
MNHKLARTRDTLEAPLTGELYPARSNTKRAASVA